MKLRAKRTEEVIKGVFVQEREFYYVNYYKLSFGWYTLIITGKMYRKDMALEIVEFPVNIQDINEYITKFFVFHSKELRDKLNSSLQE